MEVFTHFLVFFFGMALYHLLRRGLARSPDSTEHVYFVSATLIFKNHKGSRTEHYYAGPFITESRSPDKMVEEFRRALIRLVTKETPEEIFQLSNENNYHIQIHSMNRV